MEMPRTERRRHYIKIAISRDRGGSYHFCRSLIKEYNELKGSRSNNTILDLGCSVGHYATCLSEMGFDVCGLDILPELIAEANKKSTGAKHKPFFVVGAGESLPFKDDSFDLVIAPSVLEHVRYWKLTIAEIYRVLKHEGLVFISTTNKLFPWQGEVKHFPFFSYLPQQIRDWIIDSHPAWVDYTPFPARHWFTPYGLRRTLFDMGFTKVWDIIDMVKAEQIPHGIWQISKPLLPLIKKLPHFLRFPFYLFIIGDTTLWAQK